MSPSSTTSSKIIGEINHIQGTHNKVDAYEQGRKEWLRHYTKVIACEESLVESAIKNEYNLELFQDFDYVCNSIFALDPNNIGKRVRADIQDYQKVLCKKILDKLIFILEGRSEDHNGGEVPFLGTNPGIFKNLDDRDTFQYAKKLLYLYPNSETIYRALIRVWYEKFSSTPGAGIPLLSEIVKENGSIFDVYIFLEIFRILFFRAAQEKNTEKANNLKECLHIVINEYGDFGVVDIQNALNSPEFDDEAYKQYFINRVIGLTDADYDNLERMPSIETHWLSFYTANKIYPGVSGLGFRVSKDHLASLEFTSARLPQSLEFIESSSKRWGTTTHPVSYQTIFDTDDRDSSIHMKIFHDPKILFQVEQKIGIAFSDFPFAIQPPFLEFLAYAKQEDFEKVRAYLSRGKNIDEKYTRLRVFLAMTEDLLFGELILSLESDLVNKFGLEKGYMLSQKIFEKYSTIMSMAERDAENIKEEFFGSDSTAKFSKQDYIKELLKRANSLLRDVSQENGEQNLSAIEKLFDSYSVDMIQYGSLFRMSEKDTREGLDATMKNLGITMQTKKGTELGEEDWEVVRRFYEVNYAHDPRYEKIQEIIAQSEKVDSLTNDVEYSFFARGDEPLLTIKFMKQGDGSIYFGAFNAAIQFQKYSFGGFTLGEMLKKYEGKTIHAHVIEGNEHLLGYYERFGFQALRGEDNKPLLIEEGGVKFYHIVKGTNFGLEC